MRKRGAAVGLMSATIHLVLPEVSRPPDNDRAGAIVHQKDRGEGVDVTVARGIIQVIGANEVIPLNLVGRGVIELRVVAAAKKKDGRRSNSVLGATKVRPRM